MDAAKARAIRRATDDIGLRRYALVRNRSVGSEEFERRCP